MVYYRLPPNPVALDRRYHVSNRHRQPRPENVNASNIVNNASGVAKNRLLMISTTSILLITTSLLATILVFSSWKDVPTITDRPSFRGTGWSVNDPAVNSWQRLLQETNDTETCTLECCTQNYEKDICPAENEWISALPIAVQIIFIIFLLSLSALFSGLTLGLMSLDITGLEIVMAGEDPKQAQYAKNIYPVRKKGNLLLCTLLLGNVAVNSLLSIFMAAFTSGTIGFLTSTIMIVIFGEILPQALVRRSV